MLPAPNRGKNVIQLHGNGTEEKIKGKVKLDWSEDNDESDDYQLAAHLKGRKPPMAM